MKNLIKERSKFLDFFRYNGENVEHLISALIYSITLAFMIIKTSSFYNALPETITVLKLIQHYGNYIFLILGITVLKRLTLIFMTEFEFYGSPSFVLLTPESEKEKTKTLRKYKMNWLKYFATIIISITASVAANYVYAILTTP